MGETYSSMMDIKLAKWNKEQKGSFLEPRGGIKSRKSNDYTKKPKKESKVSYPDAR